MYSEPNETRNVANAQRDGRPAEYRWRPLFNAAVWLTPTTTVPCSNAAKTRNPLKLPNETISAASGPKFTILWGLLEDILLLNIFFRLSIRALVAKNIARQSRVMVPRWRFLTTFTSVFSASRVQHISELRSKFALRPHHVWKYGRHPMCGR